MISCKLCNKEFSNIRNLSIHIRNFHNISTQEYYDTFIKTVDEGKCVICGNPTNFKNLNEGYFSYCSKACVNKSSNHINSVANTKLIRYGNSSYNNSKKQQETYNNKSEDEKNKIIEKTKRTKLEKYGDENYYDKEKYKQSCIEHFGVDSPFKAPEIKDKISQKYFSKSQEEKNEIKNKRLATINNKSDEEKQEIANKHREAYFNKTEEEKQRIQEKSNETKRKNNSFNKSKAELKCKELLEKKFNNIQTQHYTDEYPFKCDFYISELNLYIECNFHWTHGKHKFNPNDPEDIKVLNTWKEKNTKYFNNAINTWTVRDVNKFNYANKNNLNYLVFYSLEEFMNWYTTL